MESEGSSIGLVVSNYSTHLQEWYEKLMWESPVNQYDHRLMNARKKQIRDKQAFSRTVGIYLDHILLLYNFLNSEPPANGQL